MFYSKVVVLALFACICVNDAFFFSRKLDCQTSDWSSWGQTFGFGTRQRERVILRHPTNGGTPCPKTKDLFLTEKTSSPPSIKSVANSVVTHFMKPKATKVSKSGKTVGQFRDLLVIVDASGSIGKSGFDVAKTELANLLGLLCPNPDPFKGYQRAALIEYSSAVVKQFQFKDKKNTFQVKQAIKAMPYFGQGTCTATAFKEAITMFRVSNGMRNDPNVKKEVLILSDGRSNCGGDAVAAAKVLQKTAAVYGLMIGSHSNKGKAELEEYVSQPLNQHLFAVSSYQDLKKLLAYIKTQLTTYPCAPFDVQ